MMTRALIVAAVAAGFSIGCEQARDQSVAQNVGSLVLAAQPETMGPVTAPVRLGRHVGSSGSVATTSASLPGCKFNAAEAAVLSTESPWGGAQDGSMWQGTNNPDPAELKKLSNSEMLARATAAGNSADRQHALVSVGRRKVPGAVDALAAALAASEDMQVREMGITGLIEHGGPDAVSHLRRALLDDKSDQIRGLAIWALAMWGPNEAAEAIKVGLKDDNIGVQGMAILAVWAIKDNQTLAMQILTDAAASDEQRIYQEAANVLMRMQRPEAARLLIDTATKASSEKKRMTYAWSYKEWRRNSSHLCLD